MIDPVALMQKIKLNMKAAPFIEALDAVGLVDLARLLQNSNPATGGVVPGNTTLILKDCEFQFYCALKNCKLNSYELVGHLDFTAAHFKIYKRIYENLEIVLSNHYDSKHESIPLKGYSQFSRIQMPADGYPTDRYVVAAMTSWNRGKRKVSLSFARNSADQLFFQLRAIYL